MASVPSLAVPAVAQAGCGQPVAPAEPIPELPWAQDWFGMERLSPLSQGQGVIVGVIDTGVDTGHPQLAGGQVRPGTDLLPEPASAHVDCDSHGTAVASIIAASEVDGVGFHGLAPAADILPVRVAEQGIGTASPDQPPQVAPGTVADAIEWATDHGAQVIHVSAVFYQPHQGIADAVQRAVDRGIIVVAGVGDVRAEAGAEFTPYPAAYPGVIGVGTIDVDGAHPNGSYLGPHVNLVAPGQEVTAASAVTGHQLWSGSGYAAAFVSASAALVRAAEPDLGAGEVVRRLLATADPGPGGRELSGYGVVNPYRALTERIIDAEPLAAEPPAEPAVDPQAEARAWRWQRVGALAVLIAVGATALGGLVVGSVAVWRRGHRRGWRPARRIEAGSPTNAVDSPERLFFTVPTPRERRPAPPRR